MKKIVFVYLIVGAIATLTSCSKDEDKTPEQPIDNGIKIEQLVGDWNIESIEIDGITYTSCDEIDFAFNSYLDVKTDGSFTNYNECNGEGTNNTMTVTDNKITFDDGLDHNIYFYEIINADTFDGTILQLKNVYNESIRIFTLQHSN